MNTNILILCDEDELYVRRLDGYIRSACRLPFEIIDVTDADALPDILTKGTERRTGSKNLIITDTLYGSLKSDLITGTNVLVLEEGGEAFDGTDDPKVVHMPKYRPAAQIVDALLALCMEDEDTCCVRGQGTAVSGKLIGFYSPVKRAGQTTLALTLGQLLSERTRTLYLNFESYPGAFFSGAQGGGDMSDLLYYFGCDADKLAVYLGRFVKEVNGLHYIAPCAETLRMEEVDHATLRKLLNGIVRSTDYETVILDLSDSVDNVCGLLPLCSHVFTVTAPDRQAKEKLAQYERSLRAQGMTEVLGRTTKGMLPAAKGKAADIAELLTGPAAAYIKRSGWTGICERGGREHETG